MPRFHVICERDVGLFSLVQQVIANIPWAMAEDRLPVALLGARTIYWVPGGHRERDTAWEYYFEPIIEGWPVSRLSQSLRELVGRAYPDPDTVGYVTLAQDRVASCYGDHPTLAGSALPIPFREEDPSPELRRRASRLVSAHVRPRRYLADRLAAFAAEHLDGRPAIGVHARGTDSVSARERRPFRQGPLALEAYAAVIDRALAARPDAAIFVATDEAAALDFFRTRFGRRVVAQDCARHEGGEAAGNGPTGCLLPAYIAHDRRVAARNGEDAVLDWLLLARCDLLIHNGSSLARTALLARPDLPHHNVRSAAPPGSRSRAALPPHETAVAPTAAQVGAGLA